MMIRRCCLVLLLLVARRVAAQPENLNVVINECSSAMLTLGPFVTEDGITPTLPPTLSIQINAADAPPTNPPTLAKTTITPPSCTSCTTPTQVHVTCDPSAGICQLLLPPSANKVTDRQQYQQNLLCTIIWEWPLGQGTHQVLWTVNRSPFSPPPC